MTCTNCLTQAEKRRIPFGDKFIEMEICKCGAERMAHFYGKTKHEKPAEVATVPDRKTLAGGE